MVTAKSYDLKSIFILSFINVFYIFGLTMMCISPDENQRNIEALMIVGGLILLFCILQLIIYLATLKKLQINYDGVTILRKADKKTILWKDIQLFSYYNEPFILEPNTLKIVYGNNELLLGEHYSNIHISYKIYKKAVAYIPTEFLNNTLFLRETI